MRRVTVVGLALLVGGCGKGGVDVGWLEAPASAAVAPTVRGATVTWTEVEGAEAWRIYLGRDPGTSTTVHETVLEDATSPQTLADLTPGETWYVVLEAVSGPAVGRSSPVLSVEPIGDGHDGLVPLAVPGFEIAESNADSRFGYPLLLGDIDGNGTTDLVTGAYRFTDTMNQAGRVQAFYGNGDGGGLSLGDGWSTNGPYADSHFGAGLSVGDVNDDGVDDIIGGGPDGNGGTGYAEVFFGGAAGSPSASGWTYLGATQTPATGTGRFTAYLGDVTGDGVGDFAVGSHRGGALLEGNVLVFAGDANGALDAAPALTLSGDQADDLFSWSMPDRPGDANGDGNPDLIIGSMLRDNETIVNAGRAQLFVSNGSELVAAPIWTIDGASPEGRLGQSVDWAGDVNADGYDDAIIGEFRYSTSGTDEGAAHLYLGGPGGLANTPAWSRVGTQAGALVGDGVAGVGDINGDGFDDVVIGCPLFDNATGADVGRVELFLGSPDGLADAPQWAYDGVVPGGILGGAIVGGADLSADGRPDFVVGISGHFGNPNGSAGVSGFHGPPTAGPALDGGGPTTASVGRPVSLTGFDLDAAAGDGATCGLRFGDDSAAMTVDPCTTAALAATEHVYAAPGQYVVRLTVTTAYGVASAAYVTLVVE